MACSAPYTGPLFSAACLPLLLLALAPHPPPSLSFPCSFESLRVHGSGVRVFWWFTGIVVRGGLCEWARPGPQRRSASVHSRRDFSALVYYDPSVHHDLTVPADCFANFSFSFYQIYNVLRAPLTVLSNRQPISALNSDSPNSIMTSLEDKHCSLG